MLKPLGWENGNARRTISTTHSPCRQRGGILTNLCTATMRTTKTAPCHELLASQPQNNIIDEKNVSILLLPGFEQLFQLLDFVLAQLLVCNKMGQHRLDRASKNPFEERVAHGF